MPANQIRYTGVMNLSRIFRNDRLTKAMTGLTRQEFDELVPVFADAVYIEKKLRKMDRQRKMGAGQKGTQDPFYGRIPGEVP